MKVIGVRAVFNASSYVAGIRAYITARRALATDQRAVAAQLATASTAQRAVANVTNAAAGVLVARAAGLRREIAGLTQEQTQLAGLTTRATEALARQNAEVRRLAEGTAKAAEGVSRVRRQPIRATGRVQEQMAFQDAARKYLAETAIPFDRWAREALRAGGMGDDDESQRATEYLTRIGRNAEHARVWAAEMKIARRGAQQALDPLERFIDRLFEAQRRLDQLRGAAQGALAGGRQAVEARLADLAGRAREAFWNWGETRALARPIAPPPEPPAPLESLSGRLGQRPALMEQARLAREAQEQAILQDVTDRLTRGLNTLGDVGERAFQRLAQGADGVRPKMVGLEDLFAALGRGLRAIAADERGSFSPGALFTNLVQSARTAYQYLSVIVPNMGTILNTIAPTFQANMARVVASAQQAGGAIARALGTLPVTLRNSLGQVGVDLVNFQRQIANTLAASPLVQGLRGAVVDAVSAAGDGLQAFGDRAEYAFGGMTRHMADAIYGLQGINQALLNSTNTLDDRLTLMLNRFTELADTPAFHFLNDPRGSGKVPSPTIGGTPSRSQGAELELKYQQMNILAGALEGVDKRFQGLTKRLEENIKKSKEYRAAQKTKIKSLLDLARAAAATEGGFKPLLKSIVQTVVENRKAAKEVKEHAKAHQTYQKHAKASATVSQQLSQRMQYLASKAGALKGVLTGFLAIQMHRWWQGVKSWISDTIDYVGDVDELGYALQVVSARAKVAYPEVQKYITGMTEMGITTKDAQQIMMDFVRYQLPFGKVFDFVAMALDLSTGEMKDFADIYEGLLRGITTGEERTLRFRDVVIDLEAHMNEWERTTGRVRESMTPFERSQLALNAVLEQGARIAGVWEAALQRPSGAMKLLQMQIQELRMDLGRPFLRAFGYVATAARNFVSALRMSLQEGGKLYGLFRKIGAVAAVVAESLVGRADEAATFIEKAATRLGDFIWKLGMKLANWGAQLAVVFAKGFVKVVGGAIAWVADVVGKYLGYWFQPQSPPRIAPYIDEWGAQTMTQWLKGFAKADYSVLETAQGALQKALGVFLSYEEIEKDDAKRLYYDLTLGMQQALAESGALGEDLFGRLRGAARQFGEAIVELVRRQQTLVQQEERVLQIEERLKNLRKAYSASQLAVRRLVKEYNAMLSQGASRLALEEKMAEVNRAGQQRTLAQQQVEEGEALLSREQERTEILREQLELQQKLLDQMISMAEYLAPDKADDKGTADYDRLPEELNLGEVGELFEEVDEEFEALMQKVRDGWAQAIKPWTDYRDTWLADIERMKGEADELWLRLTGHRLFNRQADAWYGRVDAEGMTLPEYSPDGIPIKLDLQPLPTGTVADRIKESGWGTVISELLAVAWEEKIDPWLTDTVWPKIKDAGLKAFQGTFDLLSGNASIRTSFARLGESIGEGMHRGIVAKLPAWLRVVLGDPEAQADLYYTPEGYRKEPNAGQRVAKDFLGVTLEDSVAVAETRARAAATRYQEIFEEYMRNPELVGADERAWMEDYLVGTSDVARSQGYEAARMYQEGWQSFLEEQGLFNRTPTSAAISYGLAFRELDPSLMQSAAAAEWEIAKQKVDEYATWVETKLAELFPSIFKTQKEEIDNDTTVEQALQDWADRGIDVMHGAYDMHSPSRVMVDMALNILLGFRQGLERGDRENVQPAMRALLRGWNERWGELLAGTSTHLTALLNTLRTGFDGVLTSLQTYDGGTDPWWELGKNLMGSLAGGIEDEAGRVADAAAKAVEDALAAARDVAQIDSPSKVTRYTGEMLMAGIVEGVERGRVAVYRAVEETFRPFLARHAPSLSHRALQPAAPMAGGGGDRTVHIDFGGVVIANGLDEAAFEARIRRVVSREIRK